MEAQNPLKRRAARLAISAEGMTETELFGASDVIEEDTVIAVYLHGEVNCFWQRDIFLEFDVILSMYSSPIRYSDISLEDIRRICPACRGTCNCKVCLRGDNLIKVLQLLVK